jgi:tetratricopeptide (TPR) repeat protein
MNLETEIIKAIDYSDNEDYQKAIDICTEIVNSNPNYDRAYFERAMVYLNIDKDNLAIIDFKKLMELNPEYPGAKDWYSRTLSGLGDLKSSADLKLSELRDNPNGKYGMGISPQSWAECAETYYKTGDLEKAEELLTEYFDTQISKVDKYISYETAPRRVLIKILIDTGRFEQALQESKIAMESHHKVPVDYELFIESLILNGQLKDADKEAKSYVEEVQGGYENENIVRLKALIK